jgi:hypothetical protein
VVVRSAIGRLVRYVLPLDAYQQTPKTKWPADPQHALGPAGDVGLPASCASGVLRKYYVRHEAAASSVTAEARDEASSPVVACFRMRKRSDSSIVWRTTVRLLIDALTFVSLGLRSRSQLAAENLFLRKQLALYQERRVKPRRADDATRITLLVASRLTDWRACLRL